MKSTEAMLGIMLLGPIAVVCLLLVIQFISDFIKGDNDENL